MKPIAPTSHLIQADDRERNAELLAALRNHPQIILHTQRLPIGDYLIDHRLLIERKALPTSSAPSSTVGFSAKPADSKPSTCPAS